MGNETKSSVKDSQTAGAVDQGKNKPEAGVRPKKKRTCLWVALILILILILLGAGIGLGYSKVKKAIAPIVKEVGENSNLNSDYDDEDDGTYKGNLEVKAAKIDKDKSVTKTFGPDGSTLSTLAADGTLYTLTVPPEAVILPSTVTMSPLTESPVNGFDKPQAGYGVFLDGSFSFIRPTYLTIQPNTPMPELSESKAVKWGRCAIASRGYDPEVCAGENKVAFGGGVDPGKVVVQAISKEDDKRILLVPTIPTGQANIYNAQVSSPGAYFGDKIDKKMADELAKKMVSDSYHYLNATELFMHLLTLGGDLKPYEEEIERFSRSDKSYPRATLEGAIILLSLNDKKGYDERISDFKVTLEKNFKDVRAAFTPFTRYYALMQQMSVNKKQSSLISSAFAEGLTWNWPSELPDYPGDAQGNLMSWWSDFEKKLNQLYRDIIATSYYSCEEKRWAAEALQQLGTLDDADRAAIKAVLDRCTDKCQTLEECEGEADIANRSGDRDAEVTALYRMKAYLESGKDCKAETKKTLETYGQNFCN